MAWQLTLHAPHVVTVLTSVSQSELVRSQFFTSLGQPSASSGSAPAAPPLSSAPADAPAPCARPAEPPTWSGMPAEPPSSAAMPAAPPLALLELPPVPASVRRLQLPGSVATSRCGTHSVASAHVPVV